MIGQTHALLYQLVEERMALKPGTHMGVPLTSTGHKTKLANAKIVDGKLVITPSPAPPHVRAAQRRKKGRVTGARAAK